MNLPDLDHRPVLEHPSNPVHLGHLGLLRIQQDQHFRVHPVYPDHPVGPEHRRVLHSRQNPEHLYLLERLVRPVGPEHPYHLWSLVIPECPLDHLLPAIPAIPEDLVRLVRPVVQPDPVHPVHQHRPELHYLQRHLVHHLDRVIPYFHSHQWNLEHPVNPLRQRVHLDRPLHYHLPNPVLPQILLLQYHLALLRHPVHLEHPVHPVDPVLQLGLEHHPYPVHQRHLVIPGHQ